MKTTELVAWIGAITGVASLLWNIYIKLTAGPKLVVKAYANMVQMPPPPNNPRFLKITVQNIGTAPTTLTNVEFFKVISKWKRLLYRLRLRKRDKETHALLNHYLGPRIPHKLEVGSEWVAMMKQNAAFEEDWLKTDRLHCAVHHSFSKRPAATKIIRGPL